MTLLSKIMALFPTLHAAAIICAVINFARDPGWLGIAIIFDTIY